MDSDRLFFVSKQIVDTYRELLADVPIRSALRDIIRVNAQVATQNSIKFFGWALCLQRLDKMALNITLRNSDLKPCFALVAVFTIAITCTATMSAQEVKKSESGICHCPGGQYYDRTTSYTPFESIDACMASRGREPHRGQGTCAVESSSQYSVMFSPGRYDRTVFGGWTDVDVDCQNARHERLIARSLDSVELSDDGCIALTERWNDPYTGNTYTAASDLEINHVVPLSYAWERGGALWEPEKRRRFANDSENLLPVAAKVNRTKGAAGPLEWLPSSEAFRCEYVLRFSRVIQRYDLNLPVDEAESLRLLDAELCD